MLTILWHDEESAGYMDYIPNDWFLREGRIKECVHDVIGPQSGRHKAKCDITVSGVNADLDYRPFAEFNEKWGMFLGVLRIQFETPDRGSVSQVLWKEKGVRVFRPCSTTVSLAPVSIQDFEAEVTASLRLSSSERRKRLASASKKPARVQITSAGYRRNPDVVAEVLFLAHGVCQRCNKPAPFRRADSGAPYLEVHHRVRLADEGDDTVANAIALCPNCHREAHYG